MNELITHKTWWQRNKTWTLLSLAVFFIAVLLFFVTGLSAGAASISRIYNEPEVYQDALSQANKDQIVIQKLGALEPIDKMALMEGNVAYSNSGNTAAVTVRVKGGKGKGKMDILANRENGKWIYKTIAIRMKNPDQRIAIVGK